MRTSVLSRAGYLSGTVTPTIRATLRRLRLDFGDELFHKNDEQVIATPAYQGDDYNDPTGGHRVLWGDSCVTDSNDYKVKVIARSAWNSSGSTSLWRCRTVGVNWTITALTAAEILHSYCRPGIYPVASSDSVYFWAVDSSHNLTRRTLDTSAWTWSGATSDLALSEADAYAVHPISATTAVVVAYTAPYLWAKVCVWVGSSWSGSSSDWVVHLTEDLIWSDAHWSDAVVSPDDSDEYVVAVNLNKWGSAHTIIYNSVSGMWSQPREVLPSAEQWGNLRVRVSGMEIINGRIWAATVREPVASSDIPMAHHVALASSLNGTDWADEYYVTQSTLRGKPLYASDETYCYVVGNASVARALASNRLGYDATVLKHSVVEAYGLNMTCSGVGSAQEVAMLATNTDANLSDSGLLEAGNELQIEVGASGYDYSDYCKALLAAPQRAEQWDGDEITLTGYGYASKLLGGLSYKPIAAKNYENPYSLHSTFTFDSGAARLTMRQVTGTWTTTRLSDVGRYALECSSAGIALVPHKMLTPYFIARTAFKAKVSIEGNYIVFWYEDDEHYWQAGLYLDPVGNHYLVIARVHGANTTIKESTAVTVSLGNWYTLYADARAGQVRVYFKNSDSYDFSGATTLTYDSTAETEGPPTEHHVGLRVEDFQGFEGSDDMGTVTSSTYNSLSDTAATFTASVIGKYVRCNDEDRQVIDYDTNKLVIQTSWGTTPEVGDEWGLYPEDTVDGPQAYFKELFVCEARVPWTVDDILNNMLALCGVSRNDAYAATTVGTLWSSSKISRDVDLKLTSDLATKSVRFWCSSYTITGEAAFSGQRVNTSTTSSWLVDVTSTGSAGSPYQSTSTAAIHPNLATVPGAGTDTTVRVQANEDVIVVSCDGHFLTAFPTENRYTGGYMAKVNSGDTCVTTEFPETVDFIWDANDLATSALKRLMQGRRGKVVERSDGSVAISRFDDSELGDLGTYTSPLTALTTGDRGMERVAIVEMCGAEARAFYLDPEAARIQLNFARADNPTLETQGQALVEARRLARLGVARAGGAEVQLYVQDPAVELEDKFRAQDVTYIVDAYNFAIQVDQEGKPMAQARIAARLAPVDINTGVYDTDDYDGDIEYGG
jgi:hypothetical protein